MPPRIDPLSEKVFRYLCLVTAVANAFGNVLFYVVHEPLFAWVGAPPPADRYMFATTTGFSFTVGILAFLVYRNPRQALGALIGCTVAKGLYAAITTYFFFFENLHWLFLLFGIFDAVYVVIFLLFLVQLVSPDLSRLYAEDVLPGLDRPATRKALLLGYSLTGNVDMGLARVKAGLTEAGYQVTVEMLRPVEADLFRFPLSLWRFLRIAVRATLRRPARIQRLGIAADHDYDLIVVGAQTWMVGMSAIVEAVFQDERNHAIFAGRDVAAVTVCRGLWRRTQAMTVRWLERAGGHVVGARAHVHIGKEPSRLFSLVFYLIYRQPAKPRWLGNFVQKRYGMSDEALTRLHDFGVALASRPRTVPASPSVADRRYAHA